ncbi:MAG: ligase-associated DNA damage response endonuclease PdeM [Mangrovicoccus sp.]
MKQIPLCGEGFQPRPSGALWHRASASLIVADLHLGKSARLARFGSQLLPPYETQDSLDRLQAEISATGARRVISLGDSFDDQQAVADCVEPLAAMFARYPDMDWVWVTGNHDPLPAGLPGQNISELMIGQVQLRHIADPTMRGEISGHYHPKLTMRVKATRLTRPCFLFDRHRIILPAFGTYTGGLDCDDPALQGLMEPSARAVLTGRQSIELPAYANPKPRQAVRLN